MTIKKNARITRNMIEAHVEMVCNILGIDPKDPSVQGAITVHFLGEKGDQLEIEINNGARKIVMADNLKHREAKYLLEGIMFGLEYAKRVKGAKW